MRTELNKALDSRAIDLTAYLRISKKAPLLVYVEDEHDIPFWSLLFKSIEKYYSQIDVTTLKAVAISGRHEVDNKEKPILATGKESLMKVQGLGTNKVVAVDRDFDGLIPNYHTYTDRIQTDKYVISTTYYSIENHLVVPSAINQTIQNILGCKKEYIDEYTKLLQLYNDVLNPILLLLLANYRYCYAHRKDVVYSIENLADDLSCLNDRENIPSFEKCKDNLEVKYAQLFVEYTTDCEVVQSDLVAHGKFPHNLWKVLQGHTLHSFVVCYLCRVLTDAYNISVSMIKSTFTKGQISEEIKKLKNSMLKGYKNIFTCAESILYDNPIIDYKDIGIKKIIDKINNIQNHQP